uniref:Uncharacterized protein n=1 Tax=Phlebotomus papatasi TaxID=29031 RepID=A0A1B0DLJ6_PHLPP
MKRPKSKISAVTTLHKNDNNPILVKFQNGDLLPGPQENLSCHLATDKRSKKTQKLIASCDSSVYIGDVERDPQMNTFIAIRNAVTNKMRLVQVETCSLLSEHVLKIDDASAVRVGTIGDQMLYSEFGSKKSMSNHDKMHKNKVNVDIFKNHLDDTIQKHNETVEEKQDISDFGETADNSIVPPMNKEAKNIKELYSLEEIVTPELLTELNEVAVEVLKTSPEELPIDSDFILQRIRNLQKLNDTNSEQKLLKTKALIYLDALMTLVKKVRKGQNFTHFSISDICDNVEMSIRKRFIDPSTTKAIKTAFTTRKAICHILVLAILLSDNLEISVDEMNVELKTTNRKEILEYAIYMGLKMSIKKEFLGLKMPSEMDEKRRMKPQMKRRRK